MPIFSSKLVDGLYETSEPAPHIESFVSHSWRTPGWARALAVAWYCGRCRITIAAVAVPVVWLGLRLATQRSVEERRGALVVMAVWFMPQGTDADAVRCNREHAQLHQKVGG